MSFLRRSLHIASKQLAYLIIVLLVLLISSIGLMYWLSDAIEQRQDEMSTWASDKVGYPVEIGAAGLHWLGVFPKLQLESVTIRDKSKQNAILSLDNLYIGIDVFASIQQGEPVLNDVTLTGLAISLQRDIAGKLQLKGLETAGSSSHNKEWLSWIRILNRFHLQSIVIDYSDQIAPEFSGKYQLTNAVVSHKSEWWTTTGNIRLPNSLGQQLQFQAEATIDSSTTSSWQGQAKATRLNLAPLVDKFAWQDISVEQGLVDINLSATGSSDSLASLIADVHISHAEIISQTTQEINESVVFDQLVGTFEWQNQEGDTWQLSGREIQLHINGDAWPQTGFTVQKNNDDSWLIASNYIRLSDVSSIAALSTQSPQILRQQRPAGDIEQINLRYSAQKGITALAFKLRDGIFESWQQYPGVTGLTVDVNWNDGLADIQLDSHQLTLYADTWLDDAVFFDSVTGSLALQTSDDTWRVKSNKFRVWNDDLTLQLDGQIEKQADGEIVNAVKVQLEEVVVARWQDYVPAKILSKSFKSWSDNAFQAGKIIDGDIEWVGKLSSFPYKDKTDGGFFKMQLNVEDVQLHYVPKWPDLFNVTGTIIGHGYDLIINSRQGKIADFNFVDVTTIITKLNEKHPILTVDGDLTGTTKQAALFLQNSPLNERFGKALESIELSGASNIHLNLMVPLTDTDNTEAAGFVSFIDSKLNESSLANVALDNINGQLDFDNNGVYAKNISANLLNEAVKINVQPEGKNTKVSLLGHVTTKEITSVWPASVPAFISGATDYQIDLTVLEKTLGDFYLNYELNTDLAGIEIAMPRPFTKARLDKQLFNVSVNNVKNELVYSFKYGKEVNIIAVPNKEGLRAAIKFGEEQATLPNHGIKVRGKLAELAIDDWLDWSQGLAKTDNNDLLSSIDDVSMSIDSLTAFDQKLSALNYSINKDAQGWRITLKSDQTTGTIYWPTDFNGPVPLDINLTKLILSSPKEKQEETVAAEQKGTLWPAMNISIDSLQVDGGDLGKLTLQASKNAQTWLLNSATLTSSLFTAEIVENSAMWQQSSTGQRSSFSLQAKSDDLAALLANFGYQQVIEAENTQLNVDLSWPDQPLALSRANISGSLSLNMGKGKLNDVEPGAAGRIFGLMSIAALPRRLSLDFSDLFSSGFTFDSIKSEFELANGIAQTKNLTLNGAAAKIEMFGPVDIVKQRYNQQVKVTPNVSSTLPLAGAVAGGPVGLGVGTALLVFDKISGKLFGKNIVNLISYKYHLTGPWQDPQLTVIKPETE